MCTNRFCGISLEIIIYLILIVVVIFGWFGLDMEYSLKVGVLSILIAIAIFYIGWRISRYEHRKNQIDFLKTLKFKIKEIKTMIDSYKNQPLPFYFLPLPNEFFYYNKLDYRIDCQETNKLKFCLNRIEDKAKIINLMLEKMLDSFNSFLKSNEVTLEDINSKGKLSDKKIEQFKKDNKIFKFYYPKIKAMICEGDKNGLSACLNKAKSILEERFNL